MHGGAMAHILFTIDPRLAQIQSKPIFYFIVLYCCFYSRFTMLEMFASVCLQCYALLTPFISLYFVSECSFANFHDFDALKLTSIFAHILQEADHPRMYENICLWLGCKSYRSW